jgi:superfamily I DNA/RNA helicase
VVGDPDQAIYGFRGADPSHLERFAAAFAATTLCLARNHRSPPAVVEAATAVIAAAPGRPRRPLAAGERAPGAPDRIDRFVVAGAAEEAEAIAAEIERAVGGTSLTSFDTGRADGHVEAGLAFHDIAILTRIAAQHEAIAEALDRATIPYRRVEDAPLGGRPALARLVGALERLRAGTSSSPLAADVGRRPVADLVLALAAVGPTASDERRAADLLAALALPHRTDLGAFLAELPLLREIDLALEPQKVALLTLHASKGLEFPLVFIAGCERGLLPLELPGLPRGDVEEERRLLYVGMTRARQRLVLLAARRRTLFGRTIEPAPCPFLETVPRGRLADHVTAPRRRKPRQLGLF